jgi:hypothetical protein
MHMALRTFCWLMWLYPTAFRAQFRREIIQVFTAQCDEAWALAGPLGLARIWWPAIGDLFITAIAERWSSLGALIMTRHLRIQWGGFSLMAASILSGGYLFLVRLIQIGDGGVALTIFGTGETQGDLLGASRFNWLWFTANAVLFILGTLGLQALLADSPRRWRWAGVTTIITGVALFVVGNVFAIFNLGETFVSCGNYCSRLASSGELIFHVYPTIESVGALSIFTGVLIFGILMQQRQPLAWWGNLMPLGIDVVFVAFGMVHPQSFEEYVTLVMAWTTAIFVLGFALWQAGLATSARGEASPINIGSEQGETA